MAAVMAGTEKGSPLQLPPSSPSLPCDLLREVLARCDHETLVRCAASSRLLCRCMLDDPTFLRRRAGGGGGFAPSLILGAFHSPRGGGARFVEFPAPAVVPREPIRSFVSDNSGDLLRSFDEPIACRGGLVVLRRDRRGSESHDAVDLCVCNPMTGDRCFLPPPAVYATSAAILTGEDAAAGRNGSAFQLLAVDLVCEYDEHGHYDFNVRSQLFSSPGAFPAIIMPTSGAWGPVRRVLASNFFGAADGPPVVIGRVAHWLSTGSACHGYDVIALDFDDDGGARLIEGPRELANDPRFGTNAVLLASTPDRRLGFVVVEELVISMFVLLSDDEFGTCWERRVMVVREGILAPPRWMRLDSFGESCGTVVISMCRLAGQLLLNLETKEVMHLSPDEEEKLEVRCHLYEMDLPSLTAALLKIPDYSCAASSSSKLSIKFGQMLAAVDTANADVMPKIFIGANLLRKENN